MMVGIYIENVSAFVLVAIVNVNLLSVFIFSPTFLKQP